MRIDRRELAGAVADVGVFVPIAIALIVDNGLSATAVLLPAAMLYLAVAAVYRLPVPVQPLKAFGAIAIAQGLGADEVAAGALLMGVIFLGLGRSGLIDLASKAFPKPLIRGVQLTVGLLFLKIAWGLVHEPPAAFSDNAAAPSALLVAAVAVALVALAFKRRPVALVMVGVAALVAVMRGGGDLSFGPSGLELPQLDAEMFLTAFTVLVIPQVPLTFANSCIATSDAARTYFGRAAAKVLPGRLATTLGFANVFSGAIAGMPVCHGAGGMTAHYAFGARTAGAPLVMGAALLVLALGFGAGLAALLAGFPLPVLAGLLAAAGVLHIGLLRDLARSRDWAVALVVGGLGVAFNLAIALPVGLALWWLPVGALRLRRLVARPA
jgi:sulfate permease, SulP family